jgi:glycosyltransferase involved in cell wall biosynthesis
MVPFVSVILPVYNQEKYIAETIESVLAQTFTDFEFLIVDDGSTDASAKIIQRYAEKDKRIKAFYESNAGKSAATNKLVGKATGEWCAFLDADDIMLPQRLFSQISFHKQNPAVHASSSHCYYINQDGNMFGTQRYPHLKDVDACKKVLANNEIITCSFTGLMVSRLAFLQSGGLLTRFEPCEDFEFFNRLIEKGFCLVIIQEVLMKYRIHPSAVTVKKPMLIFAKIDHVEECIRLRRAGKSEISFQDFMTKREQDSFWKRLNRKRTSYSRIFFRNAGFSMMSKQYLSFIRQIAMASFLSPDYVLVKIKNLIKK